MNNFSAWPGIRRKAIYSTRPVSGIWLLPAFAAMLLAAVWTSQFNQIDIERKIARNDAMVRSQALARLFADHVLHILRQTEHATQLFKVRHEERQGNYLLEEFGAPGGLLHSVMPDMAVQMALYDEHGQWLDSANIIVPENVSDQSFFRALAQGGADAPVFATPSLDPRTNKWQILVARRLNKPSGEFQGVFVVMFDPSFFVDNYLRANMDGNSAIVLSSGSGRLSVGRIGNRVFSREHLRFHETRTSSDTVREVELESSLDAHPRIYSASPVGKFSLAALVGVSEEHAMAGFERNRDNALQMAIAATVLIVAVTVILLRQNRTLRSNEARLRTIADAIPAMVAYVDRGLVYRFHNRAYASNYEGGNTAILGAHLRARDGDTRYAFLKPHLSRAMRGETVLVEEHFQSGGVDRFHEVTLIPQKDAELGQVVGLHIMRRDITLQKQEERRLINLAQIDALTGLLNRTGFGVSLERAMQESLRSRRPIAVCFLDIDRFKPVNDTYGHDIGDALLNAFGARLRSVLRASDTVARLGGDEFTIILESISGPEDAAATADKIVLAMRAPFELGSVTVSVSTSVGVACFRDGPLDYHTLLKQADIQLYEAKRAGRDTYRVGNGD